MEDSGCGAAGSVGSAHKKLRPDLVASCDIPPKMEWDYCGRMGRNGKARN